MIPHAGDKAGAASPSPCEELAHWLSVVQGLPDLRMHKVINARHAIRRRVYDDNGDIIDQTIERLCREVGFPPCESS